MIRLGKRVSPKPVTASLWHTMWVLMNRWTTRITRNVGQWPTRVLLGAIRATDGLFCARLLRELETRSGRAAEECLLAHLAHPVPGVRSQAARGLHSPQARAILEDALQTERCTSVLVQLSAAFIRCGGPPDQAHARLVTHATRDLETHNGPRDVGGALEGGPDRLVALLPGPQESLGALRRSLAEEPHTEEGRRALSLLSKHGLLEDYGRIQRLKTSGGRRTEHQRIIAMGQHGDPRFLKELCGFLSEMHVDPGRGFAHRRTAATALGRLGFQEAFRPLSRATRMEAVDHEGRPGAGLGIQFPVRTSLIWALGELQDRRAIPLLLPLLKDDAGSPTGGFYLAAMDALWKLGPMARSALSEAAAGGEPIVARNAKHLLESLEKPQ